jgi:hypothetical protein
MLSLSALVAALVPLGHVGHAAGQERVCIAGQPFVCACPGGGSGTALCNAQGTGVLPCQCPVTAAPPVAPPQPQPWAPGWGTPTPSNPPTPSTLPTPPSPPTPGWGPAQPGMQPGMQPGQPYGGGFGQPGQPGQPGQAGPSTWGAPITPLPGARPRGTTSGSMIRTGVGMLVGGWLTGVVVGIAGSVIAGADRGLRGGTCLGSSALAAIPLVGPAVAATEYPNAYSLTERERLDCRQGLAPAASFGVLGTLLQLTGAGLLVGGGALRASEGSSSTPTEGPPPPAPVRLGVGAPGAWLGLSLEATLGAWPDAHGRAAR